MTRTVDGVSAAVTADGSTRPVASTGTAVNVVKPWIEKQMAVLKYTPMENYKARLKL